MIGDTSHDLQMAMNAGVAGLGVSYGAHGVNLLEACKPLAIVDTMAALANWLEENG
jgi:phosphoglycolate phosphatase